MVDSRPHRQQHSASAAAGASDGAIHFCAFPCALRTESAAENPLREVTDPPRAEPTSLSFHVFRSTRDPRLFYIRSRWADEAAFESHAVLSHTVRFFERMEQLVHQPREVTRAKMIVRQSSEFGPRLARWTAALRASLGSACVPLMN